VKSPYAVAPIRLVPLLICTALSGCSAFDGIFGSDKVDYRTGSSKTQSLEVPPDLTQLARESRYQPQGGAISAAAAAAAGTTGTTPALAATPAAAAASGATLRIERLGQQRWLVVAQTPEQLWPQLKSFWDQRGFTLAEDNPQIGIMETNWAENRAKLPGNGVQSTLGRLFSNVFDTGERDRYRVRVERTDTGSEIYLSHRGAEEVYTNERREGTTWQPRPNDPQLEAEMLVRLMVSLGAKEEPARTAAGTLAAAPAAAVVQARAAATADAPTLMIDEPFDRAWRRVGLALDRGGFTVEDRDRQAGLYYVRYVDPKSAGKDEPGWWARLFGDATNPQAALRYRIVLKASAQKTTLLSVQNAAGAADTGENAQHIVGLLARELH
jgi:outer membrane protein assembly factor BamC